MGWIFLGRWERRVYIWMNENVIINERHQHLMTHRAVTHKAVTHKAVIHKAATHKAVIHKAVIYASSQINDCFKKIVRIVTK